MVGRASSVSYSLHTDVGIVVKPREGVVRDHGSASEATRRVQFSEESEEEEPRVHRGVEQRQTPHRVDEDTRAGDGESET